MFAYLILFLQFLSLCTAISSQRCKNNDYVLNDCNWCRCSGGQYRCKARLCEEVDMFGHFKDTIQELEVGMEGHGAWRSRPTVCTPGVQYQRGKVRCICDENAMWPNPVCRDIFRILHPVEVTEKTEESISQACIPQKLYLVACNVCVCSSSGKLNASLCTNKTCLETDPVLEPNEPITEKALRAVDRGVSQIYAPCDPRKKYSIGQKTCKCLDNNLLVCGNHDSTEAVVEDKTKPSIEAKPSKWCPRNSGKDYFKVGCNRCRCMKMYHRLMMVCTTNDCSQSGKISLCKHNIGKSIKVDCNRCKCISSSRMDCTSFKCLNLTEDETREKSMCQGKIGEFIKLECNKCKCVSANEMYCTSKKCLPSDTPEKQQLMLTNEKLAGRLIPAPYDDQDCIPGTSYKRGCNRCFCKFKDNTKIIMCTVKPCKDTLYDTIGECVTGTSYETNCYICTCVNIEGVKYQVCKSNPECMTHLVFKEKRSDSLDSLHGYCEPLHVYKRGCNTCRCLGDGKVLACTTAYCGSGPMRSSEPMSVEIVPLQQADKALCPEGHSYKVDCNMCVCLSNGNALCTSADCSTSAVTE